MQLTHEQARAIESAGKTIVSASAGSGKTFVMIEKLVRAVENGVDLDDVLAVTFSKKAAAQMKEKLRAAIIKRLESPECDRARLKLQLSKIPSANVSTIHSFCNRLLRTYFYALGIDAGFDIISADDAVASALKKRALDAVFERRYESGDVDFMHLLDCYTKKRSDNALREIVLSAHTAVRATARYEKLLEKMPALYTDEGFGRVCAEYCATLKPKYLALAQAVKNFRAGFPVTRKDAVYKKIFDELEVLLLLAADAKLFEKPAFAVTAKPRDCDEDKAAGEEFKAFKDGVAKRYRALLKDLEGEETERVKFFKSGVTACAFGGLLLEFDREYAAVKREENKLDYNDLEHLTLQLLEDESVREEICSGFKYAFVDEYQDVNPVQEEIVSSLVGDSFFVGDVKQAIYGFRGSKSVFFSKKYASFEEGAGAALKLSKNFRSSDGVLSFVNRLFSRIMRGDTFGIDYEKDAQMQFGGLYPEGYGSAELHIFGGEEEEETLPDVYSVSADDRRKGHTREGLAVLELVKRELSGKHYDLKKGEFVDTQAGDICILTRKNKGESTEGIIRALTDAGYSVAGAQDGNICTLPEVKQTLDILSLIDDAEQDIPLVTALLSPLGGFTDDELAEIRITADGRASAKEKSRVPFRECCKKYLLLRGGLAARLAAFYDRLDELRGLSDILTAGELIDELLENYGLDSAYGEGGERKIKNVLRLGEEGANFTLAAFLAKIKDGGYNVKAAGGGASDSVKIMTMHASKGLEFPVVIIADICRTFKGADYEEMPFENDFGFAPKCYDKSTMLVGKTLLRTLAKKRADGEELKNELNLFYVACTRAMCKLHILAEEVPQFDETAVTEARRYADLFDLNAFSPTVLEVGDIESEAAQTGVMPPVDGELVDAVRARFMQPYEHADSVDLPVKSSASAILRLTLEEPVHREHALFGGEGETGTDRGVAYHRFLELCDFSVRDGSGVGKQLNAFVEGGLMTEKQRALVSVEELCEILAMPVFDETHGAEIYREQEFLCRMPACEALDTAATDYVLIQGAIDLLIRKGDKVTIVDYKYSNKSAEELKAVYCRQLDLYKKAVKLVWGKEITGVRPVIINIKRRYAVELDK